MKAISTCSGIGGGDIALERAGAEIVAQVEIDPFCQRVLARRFPDVARFPDLTTFDPRVVDDADLVVGGTPCQDLSVAGARAGLAGERSRLFFDLVRVLDESAADWLLFENVPGLLSSHKGRDFAVVLRELTGFEPEIPNGGWLAGGLCVGPRRTVAWRLLDAQYFGLAQRRKRLFLVAHPRAECAVTVLFDSESGDGHPAPGREEAEGDPRTLEGGLAKPLGSITGGIRSTDIENETYVADAPRLAAALRAEGHDASEDGTGRQPAHVVEYVPDVAYSLRASEHKMNGSPERGDITLITQRVAHTLMGSGGPGTKSSPSRMMDEDVNLIALIRSGQSRVRRLTITERERLQGFPDGWTCLCGADPYSSAACRCPDGPRARALGNAMPVNVVEWIARRIVSVAAAVALKAAV